MDDELEVDFEALETQLGQHSPGSPGRSSDFDPDLTDDNPASPPGYSNDYHALHDSSDVEQLDDDTDNDIDVNNDLTDITTDDSTVEEDESSSILEQCLQLFERPDYIMEPKVFDSLTMYFQANGPPEQIVEMMSSQYKGLAQMCNLFAEWLVALDVPAETVQSAVEKQLSNLLLRHFDPKKADTIFHHGENSQIDWLPELITHAPWRNVLYELSERHQDCLLLNFALKLISDAGYQQEICTVSSASQQLEIFSRVLVTSLDKVLGVPAPEGSVEEMTKLCTQSEQAYLLTESLLHKLLTNCAPMVSGGLRRLAQEIRLAAKISQDCTSHTLALYNTSFPGKLPQSILFALHAVLTKKSLNPADVKVLYEHYSSNDPPPVDLIRDPVMLHLFLDALFGPSASQLQENYRENYIYLLAYAVSVTELHRKGQRKAPQTDEIPQVSAVLEKAHKLCRGRTGGTSELLPDLSQFFQCVRVAVAATGVLHWIRYAVFTSRAGSFFELHSEPTPILVILDEIANLHVLLRPRIFDLLVDVFNQDLADVDELMRLNVRKMCIERMIHLMSKDFVIPVVQFMRQRHLQQSTDTSLLRYFVTETLDVIAPPYSQTFIELMLPLVEDGSIVGPEKSDCVIVFLDECQSKIEQ